MESWLHRRTRPPSRTDGRWSMPRTMRLTTLLLPLICMVMSALADFPSIDFEGLGAVNVAGSFDGVSIWKPSLSSLNASNNYDGSSSSLVYRDENGMLSKVNSTNDGGRIYSICQRAAAPNTVFIGGQFTQIAGLNASNVAAYDPGAKTWSTLNGGVDGQVLALHCDDAHGLLFAGGSFTRPTNVSNVTDTSRYLGNLAMWNMTGDYWLPVPFGGLNGTVTQIESGTNASTLRFLGDFDTLFSSATGNQSISGTNTSASPLSVAYAPLPLGQTEFQGGPSSSNAGFADPAQILCPQGEDGSGNTYLFGDNTVGRLTMRAFRNLPVSGFRLGNTFVDGRGTKEFNIISIPDNTQLELLYLDPDTQRNVTCTSCPMFHDAAVPYQDFLITNNSANGLQNGFKTLTGIQFTASAWYGSGAGLHQMELLSDGAWAYAYEGYNRGTCSSNVAGANGTQSSVTLDGAWYHTFVTTTTPATTEPLVALSDDFSKLSTHLNDVLTWKPTVYVDGNYSVSMLVPGCSPGGQCDVRTDVQARVVNNASVDASKIPWTRVSQTNQQDAVIEIYNGPVSRSSQSFQPSIQMTIPADAPKPQSDRFTVYGDRITMTLLNSNETHQYYVGRGFGMLEYDVFDANANNNSLAYGANPYLRNTTLIGQLLNSTSAGAAAALKNSTGTQVATESVQQYIQQIENNLYSGTQALPNSTMTPVDYFSVALESAGVLRNESSIIYALQSVVNRTYVGGAFDSTNVTNATGFANFVAFDDASQGKQVARLTGGGTNGPVTTLAAVDTFIFVGGSFTATTDNKTALPYIARYDSVANTWASLDANLDGAVSQITVMGTQLLVTGAFTTVNTSTNAGGFGVYDTVANKWVAQDLPVEGTVSTIFPVPSSNAAYMAGQIVSVGNMEANAAFGLSAPAQQGQYPNITKLNLALSSTTSSSAAQTPSGAVPAPNARRSLSALAASEDLAPRHAAAATLLEIREAEAKNDGLFSRLAARATSAVSSRDQQPERQISSLSKRADAMDPVSLASNGDNEILASAFWQQDSKTYWTVLGGNFTTSTGIKNLGIYNPRKGELEHFPTMPPDSNLTVVRAIYVDKNTMYVGGDGGILSFNLQQSVWNAIPPLTATAGTVLSVQAISHRPGSSTIIVAGTFTNAGGGAASLPCRNVCQWDSSQARWTSMGNGIDGQIAALDFAGSKANTLVAAGSINLSGREVALAEYAFDTNSWTGIGTVGSGTGSAPGPATAVSVDSLNLNAIYVAGRSDAGTYPYFVKWDGTNYNDLSNGQLLSSTGVAQLTFVGLLKPHADNAVMENNRMIVLSGALNMRDYGNVSSALFDGANWTPLIKSNRASGQPGIVRAFTRGVETLTFANMHHLAVGLVILISIALGLAVVFLLVLLGLIWALLFRKRHKNVVAAPASEGDDSYSYSHDAAAAGLKSEGKHRPSSLLATLNKATENVMNEHKNVGHDYDQGFGRGAAGGAAAGALLGGRRGPEYAETHGHETLENSDETTGHGLSSQGHSDAHTGQSRFYSGDEGSAPIIGAGAAAAAGGAASHGGETDGIEAHARYAFEATHSSELGVEAGERIWILDDQDEHWWLARNASGKTGVLPASYVL